MMHQPYHTTLCKGLLKLFYSARSIETGNETEYGDDYMPALQAMDDEEEEDEADPDADNDDKEKEEDPLGALYDDEREQLINNTETVYMTLIRSICLLLLFIHLCTHVHCHYKFTNSPLELIIPPPLPSCMA